MSTFDNLKDMQGLPSAIHAEVAILGACMLDEVTILDAVGRLTADDFSLDSHRRIFVAILALLASGSGIDQITVSQQLKRKGELDAIGGVEYLAYLCVGIPRNLHIGDHVRIVKNTAKLREAYAIFEQGKAAVESGDLEAVEVLDRAIAALREASDGAVEAQLEVVGDYLAAHRPADTMFTPPPPERAGVELEWGGLTKIIGTLQPGRVYLVAARPNTGKTAWACNASRHVAVHNRQTVAHFPFEDGRDAVIDRMLCAAGRVEATAMDRHHLNPYQQGEILYQRGLLADSALYVDDASTRTVTQTRAMASALKRNLEAIGQTLHLLVIDQLSKISRKDVATRGMPKHEQVGEVSNNVKMMARELDVPILLFSQITRESAKRSDPTPQLSDLAESGSLEQDADVVIFLHIPGMYDKNLDPEEGLFIVAKNRQGGKGTVKVKHNTKFLRWEDKSTDQGTFSEQYGR